jgi:MYXO-CTERM domain-containing protein
MKRRRTALGSDIRRGGAVSAVVTLVLLAAPGSAGASNGATPRTPAVFQLEQCISVVDRSVDPMFTVEFSIPVEDSALTVDELPDSRRFQFFALCSDNQSLIAPLPNWITNDDAQRSVDAGLLPELPQADDVIENNSTWSACATPINPVDGRIPITCDATEGGVVWDTTGIAAGNYVVRGYTFEPSLNLWKARRGVVQVTDGEALPVVSLMSPATKDSTAFESSGTVVEGCMGGPDGTTVQLSWARLLDLGQDDPSDWTVFAELDASDGQFSELWEPPPEAVNQAIVFRGTATGPSGPAWVSYAVGSVIVFPGDGESDGPEPPPGLDHCGFYPDDPTGGTTTGDDGTGSTTDPDGSSGTTDAGSVSSTDTDAATDGSMTAGAQPGPGDGCGCRVPRDDRSPIRTIAWAFALAALVLRRRG